MPVKFVTSKIFTIVMPKKLKKLSWGQYVAQAETEQELSLTVELTPADDSISQETHSATLICLDLLKLKEALSTPS
jgi:hypothetical protein